MATYTQVDDTQIQDKIEKLERRLQQIITKKQEIRHVQDTLHTVKSIFTDPNDPATAKKPSDPQLGTTMDDARRLAIYQGCMAEADNLLQKTV